MGGEPDAMLPGDMCPARGGDNARDRGAMDIVVGSDPSESDERSTSIGEDDALEPPESEVAFSPARAWARECHFSSSGLEPD